MTERLTVHDIDFIIETITMYKDTMYEFIDELKAKPGKFQKDFDDMARFKNTIIDASDLITKLIRMKQNVSGNSIGQERTDITTGIS